MAGVGIQGQPITLGTKFYNSGVLFNPDTVQSVKIFDVQIGGTPAALITPVNTGVGLYNFTWNVPFGQVPGTYYDEWTWKAIAGGTFKTQRYKFEIIADAGARPAPTFPKLEGANQAVGYWGRDIYRRIECEQIPQKIRVLLQDKLLSRGKDVYFWQQVINTNPAALICSCVKNTTERPDTTCNSCYGTGYIPGYLKFFHETIYVSSVSSLTLTNTVLNKDIKPYRILLNSGQLTGTILSGAIPYNNNLGLDWESRFNCVNIKSTNTVLAEFSTDNITFYPISQINDPGKKPINTGNVYLRVTLARTSTSDRSPEFEILRIRHAKRANPYIKILRPQISEVPGWLQYGRRTENAGERFWTLPLDFFDNSITIDTPAAKIVENSFYTRVTGINVGVIFVTHKLNYNEEFGTFTEQSFEARRSQIGEVYANLVF